jgi:hypothetical protein
MNWGTKLVVAMALFMAFIITLGIKMVFSNDDSLIENDYYEQGLKYNEKYDAKRSAMTDSVVPGINVNDQRLSISFSDPAKCRLNFKRLSDAKMDTVFERFTNEDHVVKISAGDLKSGPWMLSLNYIVNGKTYLLELEIIMP